MSFPSDHIHPARPDIHNAGTGRRNQRPGAPGLKTAKLLPLGLLRRVSMLHLWRCVLRRKWPLTAASKPTRRCFWYQAEFSNSCWPKPGAALRQASLTCYVAPCSDLAWAPWVLPAVCSRSGELAGLVTLPKAPAGAGHLASWPWGSKLQWVVLGEPPGSRSKKLGSSDSLHLSGVNPLNRQSLQHHQHNPWGPEGASFSPWRGRRLSRLGSQIPLQRSTCAPSRPLHQRNGASCGFIFYLIFCLF